MIIFKEHCIFCGEKIFQFNTQDPDRWRKVVYCRTADRGKSQKSFKETILKTYSERNDKWAEEVRYRVLQATSDLHTGDGQYHKDCFSSFKCNKPVSIKVNNLLDNVFNTMINERTRI